MARNTIRINAEPEAVFAVLDDPCAYPRWVVGTRRVRAVDADWPAIGSRFHHAIGTAAAELHDSSKILERDPPMRMVLEVRFRPTGIARVEIQLARDASGTTVRLEETPISGLASRIPALITEPILTARNCISLRRLRRSIEHHTPAIPVTD